MGLPEGESGEDQTQILFNFLGKNDFFRSFIDKGKSSVINEVIKNLQVTTFERYEPIFFRGDRSTRFYIIASGLVWILLPDQGKDRGVSPGPEFEKVYGKNPKFFDQTSGKFLQSIVSESQPGTVFGELGILNCNPRMANAIAAERCSLLSLSSDTFRSILQPSMLQKVDMKNKFLKALLADFCNFDEIWRLSAYFELLEVEKHTKLATEGDPFTHVFIIESGGIELSKKIPVQKENINLFCRAVTASINSPFIVYGQNQLVGLKEFGEKLEHYFFSMKASQPSVIYSISVNNLHKCLDDYPSFRRFFNDRIERHLQKLNVSSTENLPEVSCFQTFDV